MNHARAAKLLKDSSRAGIYRLSIAGRAALIDSAAASSFAVRRVDLSKASDKQALIGSLADALEFPQWFGHNWDALADCLGDLSWLPAKGYLLLLEGVDAFRARQEQAFSTGLDVLAAAADSWREAGVPFWVLLDATSDDIPALPSLK